MNNHVEDSCQGAGALEFWGSLIAGTTLLSIGLTRRSKAGYAAAAAGGAIAGMSILKRFLARKDLRPAFARGIMVKKSVIVNKTPEECYRFWRKLETLPLFMKHLESVKILDERRSHWVVKTAEGRSITWDAEITSDRENEMIGWRSLPGSRIDTAGSVRFERARVPGGRGTEVRVVLKYHLPGGFVAGVLFSILGKSPGRQIEEELREFKRLMEEPGRTRSVVEVASEDSFPASDAPTWTSAAL